MFKSWLAIVERCEVATSTTALPRPTMVPPSFLCLQPFRCFSWSWTRWRSIHPFVLLAIAVPLMTAGCLLPLRPIKGWLVASQFVNKAIEAGTEKLWSQMHPAGCREGGRGRRQQGGLSWEGDRRSVSGSTRSRVLPRAELFARLCKERREFRHRFGPA